MTSSDLESSWNQLKGDVRLAQRTQPAAPKADTQEESLILKPALHLGTFIRRRSQVQGEQAGRIAAR
jgi:hypothetical protein